MKTIANILHNKNFPLKIRDDNGNMIYCEYLDEDWWSSVYNDNGRETYYRNSEGYWRDTKYDDDKGYVISSESNSEFQMVKS